MTNNLEVLGFRKRWIYETIILSQEGKHAAPMGIWTEDLTMIKLDVYKGSQTLSNIQSTSAFKVAFPKGVSTFYRVLADKSAEIGGFDAMMDANATDFEDLGKLVRITARIGSYDIKHKPTLINRAQALALECLIKSTKPNVDGSELRESIRVIRKVAPSSVYEEILRNLLKKY